MKILHVAETVKGGVASVMRQLVSFQSEINTVSILIPNDQSKELDSASNCHQYYFRRTGRNIISFLSLLFNFILLVIKNNPDIVHIHSSFAGVICRVSLIVLYPIRRPIVIYCPHGFSFLMSCPVFKLKIYTFIERSLQFITDKIICTSHYEKKKAIINGINENKLYVIYNGVDFINIGRSSSCSSSNKMQILFVGRFDRQKGYDYLIKLIERLDKNQFDFTIIGEAVYDDIYYLKQSNVKYVGWLKYQDIIPYFKNSTVLVMPSRWESFGLVAVEAQSFGLPVIANNCSALPEVILDGRTGYLFDFEEDLDSVINILNDKTINWHLMETDCIQFVCSRFSAKKMNDITYCLYDKLIKN